MTEFPETQSLLLANIRSLENREAWEDFVLLYRPVIYRMARRRGMQDSDAQDLTQEVLLRVARSFENWESKPGVRFRHWLRKVAHNAILTALGKTHRRRTLVGAMEELLLAEAPDSNSAAQELQNECLRERYQRAATIVQSDVSPATWQAFEATVVQGLTCERAAETLGKSIGTVYASRSRILKRLQREVQRLEEEWS